MILTVLFVVILVLLGISLFFPGEGPWNRAPWVFAFILFAIIGWKMFGSEIK